MTETSVILQLKPESVAPDYKYARPYAGSNIEELEKIAKENDWPGYFGDPAHANPSLGAKIYQQWLVLAKDLVNDVLNGKDYRKRPRHADLTSGDPADIAAKKENARLEAQHAAWLEKHGARDSALNR